MLLEPLGRGGMGEVYNGFDETLKRRVALKAIRAEHRLSPQARTRFLREAQILSQLDFAARSSANLPHLRLRRGP
jgi:eukaryotic-like serine/threonine-protein kinase